MRSCGPASTDLMTLSPSCTTTRRISSRSSRCSISNLRENVSMFFLIAVSGTSLSSAFSSSNSSSISACREPGGYPSVPVMTSYDGKIQNKKQDIEHACLV